MPPPPRCGPPSLNSGGKVTGYNMRSLTSGRGPERRGGYSLVGVIH